MYRAQSVLDFLAQAGMGAEENERIKTRLNVVTKKGKFHSSDIYYVMEQPWLASRFERWLNNVAEPSLDFQRGGFATS
jgi:hypothetical protein